jgi:hypothetical protein
MDFKKATDELMAGTTRGEIAAVLGCSVATVRQARLSQEANAHRNPPPGWEAATARLARLKAAQLQKLADRLA